MKENKSEIEKYLQQLSFTPCIESCSKNGYQKAKRHQEQNNDDWPIQYLFKTIRNIDEVTPLMKDRLNKIRNLPKFDNLVPLCAKGYKKGPGKFSEIFTLSDYLHQSKNLEQTIKNHQDLKRGTLNSIFFQVARAMIFLQQHGLHHLRLNPSAILIKLPNLLSAENPLVRVCDIGILLQKNYYYNYCLHKDYYSGTDPYKSQNSNCIKYDLWAFGVIIYYAIKQKLPFHGVTSFFNPTLKFKEKYLSDPEKWLRKTDNSLDKQMILDRVIVKCWGLNKENIFSNWTEVLEYFKSECNITRIQQMPTYIIYINHIRLIFILSKLYLMLKQELMYKTNAIWQNKSNDENQKTQKILTRISQYLLCISYCYQNIEFDKHFVNRCYVLSVEQRNILKVLKEYIQNEKDHLQQNINIVNENRDLRKDIFGKLQKQIVKFKMVVNQSQKNKSQKMKLIERFLDELLVCFTNAHLVKNDRKKDDCEFLSVFYETEVLKNMAIKDFGFEQPKRVSLID